MNTVIKTKDRALISIDNDEMLIIVNALNEVINNSDIDEVDCHTRIGVDLKRLKEMQQTAIKLLKSTEYKYEVASVWKDGESVQVKAITVHGDPIDMDRDEFKKTFKIE